MLKLVVSGDPILENDCVSIVAILEPPNDPSRFAKGETEKKDKAISNDDEDIFLVLIDPAAPPGIIDGAMKEIELSPSQGMFVVYPYPNRLPTDRFSMYCAGPTNCGKSTVISKTAEIWGLLKRNRGKPIYIFSRGGNKDQDVAFKWIRPRPTFIPLDEHVFELKTDDFTKSLVIFDDIDVVPDKKMRDHIIAIRTDILQAGRKKFIDIMNSSHLVLDFNKTRQSITESTVCVVFPTSGMQIQISRLLSNYVGLDKNQIQRIKSIQKWIAIYTIAPRILVHSHGAFVL
jgi:hypothetical protein